ncbi:hypothetical protein P2G74_09805, partial [Cronobacter muytjensii]|uniref:hypothetical protein n=1 Tax=Cronobacter muytjensii TaxID=413501 RepID=UPI002DBFD949
MKSPDLQKQKPAFWAGSLNEWCPDPDKNGGSVFAQRAALSAGRVAGMRRVNRTTFDEESGSPKAKTPAEARV